MSSRILVVDDEPAVVETLREILLGAGYQTLGATSFEDGRRLLLATPVPDVIVADIRLGDFNGLQLVLLRPDATAAIVITGHPDPVLEAEARQHGAAYLSKPIAGPTLIETVAQVLAARASGNSD